MVGTRIGPYEVISRLGRGGMGEVYLARDTILRREVALKVLPAEFSADPRRLERLRREARVLARLQHQCIAAIHGVEECSAGPVLVLEYAGTTVLADRMGSHRRPIDEVVSIACQLASGLEYAHEHGVIHRDLKPGNVVVDDQGRLKILDFGLAKAVANGSVASGTTSVSDGADTCSRDLTTAGAIIGSAGYMSPEQVRGQECDRRTDIWAFGVILFEMLAGTRLFAGETPSDTMAAVLGGTIDWSRLPSGTPQYLVHLCRRCLERDRELRLRDIGEARVALQCSRLNAIVTDGGSGDVRVSITRRARLTRWFAPVLIGVAAAVLVNRLGSSGSQSPAATPAVRSGIGLPGGYRLSTSPDNPGRPVVSPTGAGIAFVCRDTSGMTVLGIQHLASGEFATIPGSEGAAYPFWSPDGRTVAFFARGQLYLAQVDGGPIVSVCTAENGKGGAWNEDGAILYSPSHASSIFLIDASGGVPRQVTWMETESACRSHRYPVWLPDGRHFLYLAWVRGESNYTETVLRVASIDGTETVDLMFCPSNAVYAAGLILYVDRGNLLARPFDVLELAFTGPTQVIAGDVLAVEAAYCGMFSASDNGILTFVRTPALPERTRLVWWDETGLSDAAVGLGRLHGFDLSPGFTEAVYSLWDDRMQSFDLWIHDLSVGQSTRLTSTGESEISPIWAPGGSWIYYSVSEDGRTVIKRTEIERGRRTEPVVTGETDCFINAISSSGRFLAYTMLEADGGFHVWAADLSSAEGPIAISDHRYNATHATFSPDERWVAFTSDATGGPEVFVEPFRPDGSLWRISVQGGRMPVWSADGEKVYFLDGSGIASVAGFKVDQDAVQVSPPEHVVGGLAITNAATMVQGGPGNRLLLQMPTGDNDLDRIEVLTGWDSLYRPGTSSPKPGD